MARPFVVGILGGVASGKSTVAGLFEALGVRVLDADSMGKEVLTQAGVSLALVEEYGKSILASDGTVDASSLADAAFGPPPRTEPLNRIVHPRVRERLLEEIGKATGPVVLDAALLLEGGLGDDCDLVVFVSASRENREMRARSRRWPEGELGRREEAQASLEEKRGRAKVTLDNDGGLDALRDQVEKIFRRWIVPAAGG
jgi:dephospho-CoA kinase